MSATTQELIPLPKSLSLWAIDQELQNLMEQAALEEEDTGNVTPETLQAMQLYFQAAVEKVDRIAGYLKLEKVLEPAYRAEMRRLQWRWQAYQNGFERCKQMMLEFLRARGETKIKGQTNTISRQSNSQASLVIEDAKEHHRGAVTESEVIPERFQRMTLTVTREFVEWFTKQETLTPELGLRFTNALVEIDAHAWVDESAVRAALLAGEEVPGAQLKTGEHIRLR